MKKIFPILTSVCIVIFLTLLTSCNAGAGKNDSPTKGLVYQVSENGEFCFVTGYEGSETDIVIPSEYEGLPVQSISGSAFKDSAITSVRLPDSVTGIYYQCFSGCTSLKKIEFGTGIKYIEQNAFNGCTALEEVHIKDLTGWCKTEFKSVSWNNSHIPNCSSNPLKYADKLYLNGHLITDLVIPADVTSIKDYAFYGYKGLKSVTFNDKTRTISNSAFAECENLETVNFGTGELQIRTRAFTKCNSLKKITIPKNVKYIEPYAFRSCENLKEVNLEHMIWNFSETYNAGIKLLPEDLIATPEIAANFFTDTLGSRFYLYSKSS